jgi:hypothetical protein
MPVLSTGEFGTLSHAITWPGTYFVTMTSHSSGSPDAVVMAQWERPSSKSVTPRRAATTRGKFSKLLQRVKISRTGRSTTTVVLRFTA